jgi:hypothetical protein
MLVVPDVPVLVAELVDALVDELVVGAMPVSMIVPWFIDPFAGF